ncbi:hypothetical protein R50072_32170 [Simiduia litorea]|uniref:outer membrane beta-barrel protein n=1 Tax=Simiduia litorea TaxID=1435348 RepID=UPI0036F1A37F
MLLRTIVATLLASLSFITHANEADEGFYMGLSAGVMNVDIGNASNPTNAAIQMGYHFSDMWAIEAQYSDSMRDGKVDLNYGYYTNRDFEFGIQTLAAYGVFRTRGDVFFKAKAGLVREKVLSVNDTGASAGVGLGFRLGESKRSNVELEATIIEADVLFLSAGFNIGF